MRVKIGRNTLVRFKPFRDAMKNILTPPLRSFQGDIFDFDCTACRKSISVLEAHTHPSLKCLICNDCKLRIEAPKTDSTDRFGDDNYCRWCAKEGVLFICMGNFGTNSNDQRCHNGFCYYCISNNVPNDDVLAYWHLSYQDKCRFQWTCYACMHTPIQHLQDQALLAINEREKIHELTAADIYDPHRPERDPRRGRNPHRQATDYIDYDEPVQAVQPRPIGRGTSSARKQTNPNGARRRSLQVPLPVTNGASTSSTQAPSAVTVTTSATAVDTRPPIAHTPAAPTAPSAKREVPTEPPKPTPTNVVPTPVAAPIDLSAQIRAPTTPAASSVTSNLSNGIVNNSLPRPDIGAVGDMGRADNRSNGHTVTPLGSRVRQTARKSTSTPPNSPANSRRSQQPAIIQCATPQTQTTAVRRTPLVVYRSRANVLDPPTPTIQQQQQQQPGRQINPTQRQLQPQSMSQLHQPRPTPVQPTPPRPQSQASTSRPIQSNRLVVTTNRVARRRASNISSASDDSDRPLSAGEAVLRRSASKKIKS